MAAYSQNQDLTDLRSSNTSQLTTFAEQYDAHPTISPVRNEGRVQDSEFE